MGMFDYIRCSYPLPAPDAAHQECQTKDLECVMDRYEIREDGTLWHEAYDIEDRSNPNAEGIERIFGMMTRVNERWERVADLTGEVRFYTSCKPEGWLEFSAYFVRGQLEQLNLIEDTRAAIDAAAKQEEKP